MTAHDFRALHVALDVARTPLLRKEARRRALPESGMLDLIRIAAGCETTMREASRATAETSDLIRQSAELYLQQALFAPAADHYRVLGAAPDASPETLRAHFLWLMRWLHPDQNASDWKSVYVHRVTDAWETLKRPGGRARYDRMQHQRPDDGAFARPPRPHSARTPQWLVRAAARRRTRVRRVKLAVLVVAVGATVAAIIGAGPEIPSPWSSGHVAGVAEPGTVAPREARRGARVVAERSALGGPREGSALKESIREAGEPEIYNDNAYLTPFS